MLPESQSTAFPAHRFSIAPMLDWTDRHCRYFLRLLSSQTLLYTEMVTTGAIIHGKGDYLAYSEEEHPVALQLGGAILRRWRSARSSLNSAVMTKSISTWVVLPTACRMACLALA
jgi:tRNA-dihydrouridine synthase